MQGTRVRSLVGELRSHMLRGAAKKKTDKQKPNRLAQSRPPFPAVEPWASSRTELVFSVKWREE